MGQVQTRAQKRRRSKCIIHRRRVRIDRHAPFHHFVPGSLCIKSFGNRALFLVSMQLWEAYMNLGRINTVWSARVP
jgi:hypothetical protein